MRVVVFGASSGIAAACLRLWAPDAGAIGLIGRSPDALNVQADDLRVRAPGAQIEVAVHDLGTAAGVEAAVDAAFSSPVDVALIAFGTMPSQAEADADATVAADLLDLNGSMTLLAAHLVALRLINAGHGRLGVIGSVAGDRGRQSNYLYGAAKAMVATGVAGLQHRAHGTGVTISMIKPGPTDTPMTSHLRGGKLALAPVDEVAAEIVTGIAAGRPVVYAPKKWRLIMAVIRNLPRSLFHRTKL